MRRLIAISLGVLACACGNRQPASPSSDPNAALPIVETTADYTFHRLAEDSVDSVRQQAFHAWATMRMEVSPAGRIHYYKYRDRSHMRHVTGHDSTGWADPAALVVHSIWTWDSHEAAHVLAGPLGQPTEFFNEGMAMAFSVDVLAERYEPLWNNRSVHEWCAAALASGMLPPLRDIVESNAFRSRPAETTYQTAGSFVRYLLDAHGMAPLKRLFSGSWRDASAAAVNQRMAAAYDMDLAAAEAQWHAFLRTHQ